MYIIHAFTSALEKTASNFSPLAKLYGLYYRSVVNNEVALARINPLDMVLCIGGGYVPSTAIQIAKSSGARVRVLDIDPDAVSAARKIIKRLGLDRKIEVIHGDGSSINLNDYSVVHIALQVSPREKILHHVTRNMKKNTRVLVRCPRESLKGFYSSLPKECICEECQSVHLKNPTMKTTVVIKSKRRVKIETNSSVFNSPAFDGAAPLLG